MKIRSRLTLQFSLMVSFTILILSFVVYLISANYRSNQFKERLEDKALTTVKLLVEVTEIDSVLLKIIESADQTILYKEKVVIADSSDKIIFDSRNEAVKPYNNDIFKLIRNKKSKVSGDKNSSDNGRKTLENFRTLG